MTDFANAHDSILGLSIRVLRSVVGHRIVGVSYKTSADLLQCSGQGEQATTHDVDHAVLVSTESMTIVLEWCIRNYDEFLNIVSSPSDGASAAVTDVLDVTSLPQWRPLVGSVISGFGIGTQYSEEGHRLLWSVRLDVENGASVVVALGETEGTLPSYQPDNLVVIFEPDIAQAYQVLDAPESAWGRDLHL